MGAILLRRAFLLFLHVEVVVTHVLRSLAIAQTFQRDFVSSSGQGAGRQVHRNALCAAGAAPNGRQTQTLAARVWTPRGSAEVVLGSSWISICAICVPPPSTICSVRIRP